MEISTDTGIKNIICNKITFKPLFISHIDIIMDYIFLPKMILQAVPINIFTSRCDNIFREEMVTSLSENCCSIKPYI